MPNCSQREAALKFGISQYALCNLLKNKDNVRAEIVANGNLSYKQKQERKAEDIEEALLECFRNVRLKKVPISCRILCEKAEEFVQIMFVENFNPC